MAQTHALPTDLTWGHGSRAHFSLKPNGTVVIFVHGFGGYAVGSWQHFPTFFGKHGYAKFDPVDFIFYGYKHNASEAIVHTADDIESLLDTLALNGRDGILDANHPCVSGTYYSRCILVAHCSGAVAARRAILNLHARAQSTGSAPGIGLHAEMVLFAPAHYGVRSTYFGKELFATLKLPLAYSTAQYFNQLLADLTPGSITLKNLESDTKAALAAGENYPKAKKVLHGKSDREVDQNVFCADPPTVFVPNKGHVNLCQPDDHYDIPAKQLLGVL